MNENLKILLVAVISCLVTILGIYGLSSLRQPPMTPQPSMANISSYDAITAENLKPTKQASDETNATIDILNQELVTARQKNQRLELEVEWLHNMLAEATSPDSLDKQDNSRSKPPLVELWFDDQALLAAGVEKADVDRIKEAVNKAELNKLYLRNQIARGESPHIKNIGLQIKNIQQELRQSLSEQDYDRMLFATGQNNRVKITDTLGNSPAATAGIQNNDQILSYAGEPIYNPNQLYKATAKGETGETIAIEVLRNKEKVTLYVPRGPLGTRLQSIRATPQ